MISQQQIEEIQKKVIQNPNFMQPLKQTESDFLQELKLYVYNLNSKIPEHCENAKFIAEKIQELIEKREVLMKKT